MLLQHNIVINVLFVYLCMVRTVVKPEDEMISIKLPQSFVGKEVEVIAFTVEEAKIAPGISDEITTHFASQDVLAKDWLTEDEDLAWQDL